MTLDDPCKEVNSHRELNTSALSAERSPMKEIEPHAMNVGPLEDSYRELSPCMECKEWRYIHGDGRGREFGNPSTLVMFLLAVTRWYPIFTSGRL